MAREFKFWNPAPDAKVRLLDASPLQHDYWLRPHKQAETPALTPKQQQTMTEMARNIAGSCLYKK